MLCKCVFKKEKEGGEGVDFKVLLMAFYQVFQVHSHCIICLQQRSVVLPLRFVTRVEDETQRYWKTFSTGSHFCAA